MNIRRLFFGVLMLAAWLLFVDRIGPVWLAVGTVLALVGEIMFSRMFSNDAWLLQRYQVGPGATQAKAQVRLREAHIPRRLAAIVGFLPVLAYEVITSGFYIALLALRPRMDLHPGIVRIKGRLPNVAAVTVIATTITLSPGTLTIDYDPHGDDLYVHWITVTTHDPDEVDKIVAGRMRRWLWRIFG